MRYLPHTNQDRKLMMAKIGIEDIDELFADIPKQALTSFADTMPSHSGELEVTRHLQSLSNLNLAASKAPSFLGGGAYRHHIPATVDALIQRGEFLTSYTPYQPEISQGTLQAVFEFQTQVALLTGMELANASMYDGSTACAEAVLMAGRITKRKNVILSGGLHPFYCDVVETLAQFSRLNIEKSRPEAPTKGHLDTVALEKRINEETACVVVQYPDFFGLIRDFTRLGDQCKKSGALLIIVFNEPVALGALKSPGEMGADIVVGEGQSLGVGLNFGGPYVGLFATKTKYLRQTPGRIAGQTEDLDGKRGWVLTLNAREQHIRREKATSNICTNSGLCALAFSIHLSLLGEKGLSHLATLNHEATISTADQLTDIKGVEILNESYFNEFTVRLPKPAGPLVENLARKKVLAGIPIHRLYPDRQDFKNLLLVNANELTSQSDIEMLANGIVEELS
ncbi:MAG: aminomethyl-transferring glycine dehydrogenase subunit GcvPA [Pseudomonadota bacterium]|nr:aminomethyl-transferring glycine dehydrogenase subunit GcvPA [Pseudomonadota bacterium]